MEFKDKQKGITNKLIGTQTARFADNFRPCFDIDPLCATMKIWTVADYFVFPKLLATLAQLEESFMHDLGRQLAMPSVCLDWADPNGEDAFKPCDEQLQNAIVQLEAYAAERNYAVVDAFQPTVMRLILCGRHRFSTRRLCKERPELVEGWETVLDRPRLSYPHYARPAPDDRCPKCQTLLAVDDGVKVNVLDMLRKEMGGFLSWSCQSCFTVPTLAEWKEVQEMYRIDKEEALLQRQFDDLRAVLQQQRNESWNRLDDASKTEEYEVV